jgi:phosphoesterase RecJ-like protein
VIEEFKNLLKKYDKVTIITHKNPDADTLGTGLGLYELLKNSGKEVEICNIDKKMPKYLEFLPHFAKIKSRIDFDNSLIITCDAGSIDLLGFDLSLREIVNIDHHKSNTNYGRLNIVNSHCASASMVAYMLLKQEFTITKNVATCFYVALVTDTQNFTTLNVNEDVFQVASDLIALGVDLKNINKQLTQRKSLSSFRVLSRTLDTLELSEDAQLASMVVSHKVLKETGATLYDTIGLIDYALALVTVKIAILIIEFENHMKVSFRSDAADVASLAVHFGGGGHLMASGFTTHKLDKELLLKEIKKEIRKRELIDAT